MKISAVLIAFNEEKNIADAIKSVAWADEIVVVDSESTDRTREIAADHGARVLVRPWSGFSAQKQFATDQAEYDWILSLDADERVSHDLAASIARVKAEPLDAAGYYCARLAFYGNRPIRYGGWYPDRQLRLFDRRRGRWSDVVVHESFMLEGGAATKSLEGDILHFTIDGVLDHHRMIGERYAPLGAARLLSEGTSPRPALRGILTFAKTYFIRLGFLDGFAGICVAWLAAHNTFMKHAIAAEQRFKQRNQTPPYNL